MWNPCPDDPEMIARFGKYFNRLAFVVQSIVFRSVGAPPRIGRGAPGPASRRSEEFSVWGHQRRWLSHCRQWGLSWRGPSLTLRPGSVAATGPAWGTPQF